MRSSPNRRLVAISLSLALLCGAAGGLLGLCGPFTDVVADAFCPFVLEVFYLGITTGTTPTTYDPASAVSRLQMAAFLSRTVDGVTKRQSLRTVENRFWNQQLSDFLPSRGIGINPQLVQADGEDIWVAVRGDGVVKRLNRNGLIDTWAGAGSASGIVIVDQLVFATGHTNPGNLYALNVTNPPGAVTTVATNLGVNPFGIAYDGARLFTANNGPPGSVSIALIASVFPVPVTTVTTGFSSPNGVLFDGANIWVTDFALKKLDPSAAILQTVTVGSLPFFPVFDGTNIWVPNASSNSVSVVRASTGAVLATLTASGLNIPVSAAFDGERILVTNAGSTTVSLWNAANFSAIGTFDTGGTGPYGACSDGSHFWITQASSAGLVRF
ncbi:MAG TPA: S-layer homology domain-containing protein [Thermoanaerobaculia bacterium]|nr:S-layer homology domain-containing protein [Thermoanaerobaculia bacterium]